MNKIGGWTIGEVVEDALELAGGQSATPRNVRTARRAMYQLLIDWEAQGHRTYRIRFHTVGLGDTNEVAIPDYIDDILNCNVVTDNSKVETPMTPISAARYARLATKQNRGKPSQYYFSKEKDPKIYVYPVGVGYSLRLCYVEHPEDYARSRPDLPDSLPARWLKALVDGLAYEIARRRPDAVELRSELKQVYAESLANAKIADRAQVPLRLVRGRYGSAF